MNFCETPVASASVSACCRWNWFNRGRLAFISIGIGGREQGRRERETAAWFWRRGVVGGGGEQCECRRTWVIVREVEGRVRAQPRPHSLRPPTLPPEVALSLALRPWGVEAMVVVEILEQVLILGEQPPPHFKVFPATLLGGCHQNHR